jgi:hypothetical protein
VDPVAGAKPFLRVVYTGCSLEKYGNEIHRFGISLIMVASSGTPVPDAEAIILYWFFLKIYRKVFILFIPNRNIKHENYKFLSKEKDCEG